MIDNELKVIKVLNQGKFKLSPLKLNSDDQYSFNDAYNKNIIAELKHRQVPLGAYPNYMLERDKYIRLMNIATTSRRIAYYINSFDSGEIIGWSLMPLWKMGVLNWQEKLCPATTEFGNNQKINKIVTFLSSDYAEILGNLPESI
tara:strand:- start:209 stop:643 length:435 start_codon:yes stop_codon:yes gene_type:complete